MTDEKKRSKVRFNGIRCFFIILAVYLLIAIVGQQSKINALKGEIDRTNDMIAEKNSEVAELEDQKELYAQGDEIERIARDELGFVRSDETVFVDVTGK